MRRSNSEGSYSVLTDGRVRFKIRKDGQEYTREAKTRKLLAPRVARLLRDLEAGVAVKKAQTVAAFLCRWLDEVIQPTREDTTFRGYEQHVRLYLLPLLGHIELGKLTSGDVRSAMLELEREDRPGGKLSDATVTGAFRVLRNALNQALRETPPLIRANPCNSVHRRAIRPKVKRTLPPDALPAFVKACRGTRHGEALIALVSTGLRESELLALKASDLDLGAETPIIRVERKLRLVRSDMQPGPTFGKLKSEASQRVVPLSPLAASAFRFLLEHMQPASDLLVCREDGRPLAQSGLSKPLARRLKAAGLPRCGLHDLRKTYGSMLARAGVPIHVTKALLGHSEIRTTSAHYLEALSADFKATAEIEAFKAV